MHALERDLRYALRSLRLGRIGRSASHADSPQLRGMLRVVGHLVEVDGDGRKESG